MKRMCLILATVVSVMMLSCNPTENDDNTSDDGGNIQEVENPTVVTKSVEDITETTARVICQVTDDGGAEVIERGVSWNMEGAPGFLTPEGEGLGMYNSYLSSLEANTTYCVRAYAKNSAGISYGEEMIFTTLNRLEEYDGEISGHAYVDLGLSSGLKWATCNIGANNPEDYGDYFAWGETITKTEYTSSNSVTCELSISQLQSQGYVDGGGNLTSSHDAATANWGGTWRLPTKEECQELVDNCTWEWARVNGVGGVKVIGPNGNCIFLPAAGCRYGIMLCDAGIYGRFWSSTPDEYIYDYLTYFLYFYDGGESESRYERYYGMPVRPVSE